MQDRIVSLAFDVVSNILETGPVSLSTDVLLASIASCCGVSS